MDFNNAILTSVYPHQQGDASTASDTLMSNMLDNQLDGQLVRISPNVFLYMTTETDDQGNVCPVCHMVVSTDTDHYVGGLSTDDDSDEDDDTDDDDTDDDIIPLDDIIPFDDSDGDDNDTSDIGTEPAPTDADQAGLITIGPISTTLAPAVNVINDRNDMLNTDLGEAKCDDEKDKRCKDSKLDETAYIEYPHQVENLDEAIQQISTALTNRYGGSITLHEGHCLTHVRKDGLVDRVQAVQGKYKIKTHKLKD